MQFQKIALILLLNFDKYLQATHFLDLYLRFVPNLAKNYLNKILLGEIDSCWFQSSQNFILVLHQFQINYPKINHFLEKLANNLTLHPHYHFKKLFLIIFDFYLYLLKMNRRYLILLHHYTYSNENLHYFILLLNYYV